MENASKALLMAGGVLIGVLILSLAAYLFSSFRGTTKQVREENKQKEVTQFNANFTSYLDKELTIYDVVTIARFAADNDVVVKFKGTEIQGVINTSDNDNEGYKLIQTDLENGAEKYKINEVKYEGTDGRVSSVGMVINN